MSLLKKKTTSKDMLAPGKHLSDQKNWYADRYQAMVVQRNILALVTLISLLATLISAFSVSLLTPLKSVQPFVIQVDEKSGMTQVVTPLSNKELETQKELAQYFVVKYVRAREGYDAALYTQNYHDVRLMSDSKIWDNYKKLYNSNNPQSPTNLYGRETKRVVSIRSFQFTGEKSAQVRIRVALEGPSGIMEPTDYIVWVSYEFQGLELTTEQRYVNPVGFKVTSYTVDQEFGSTQ
jgi:type IV secretion system protein VirB8